MSYDLADNLFTAPTPIDRTDPTQGLRQRLPLDIIWRVLGYVKDADLAALCRTSRLLNYMATNLLYRRIYLTLETGVDTLETLPSDDVDYNHASSFAMGLLALTTKKSTNVVEYLHLDGDWPGQASEDVLGNRKYLDESVMLNIAIRAALQACQNITELRWTLDGVKPMLTCYSAMTELPRLTTLYLKFSNTPLQQPRVVIPPMPQLTSLTLENFDLNSNPADLSQLIYNAQDLQRLNIGFSPRFMKESEPVPLLDLLHLNIEHSRKLGLRHLGVYHAYISPSAEVYPLLDTDDLESLTVINSLDPESPSTPKQQIAGLYDQSWNLQSNKPLDLSKVRIFRTDKINAASLKDLASLTGIEELYLVSAWKKPKKKSRSRSTTTTPSTIDSASFVPGSPLPNKGALINKPYQPTTAQILRDSLIDTISQIAGPRLRNLIMSSRFPLRLLNLSRLVAACPNMEQIAFAQDELSPAAIRQVAPGGTKLKCFRMLRPEHSGPEGIEARKDWDEFEPRNDHAYFLELELTGTFGMNPLDAVKIKWIGVGDRCYEAGTLYEEKKIVQSEDGDEIETRSYRRSIKEIPMSAVSHLELWKYDVTSDIV